MTVNRAKNDLSGQPLLLIVGEEGLGEADAASLLHAVALRLRELHDEGLLYGVLSVENVWIGDDGNPSLLPREESVLLKDTHVNVELFPPWLISSASELRGLAFARRRDDVQQAFVRAGIFEDVQQIDLYQFGTLCCEFSLVSQLQPICAARKRRREYRFSFSQSLTGVRLCLRQPVCIIWRASG